MYKFRISHKQPFWSRNNENKPNKALFEKWLNENMLEIDNLPINFNGFISFTLNGSYNDVKYIEVKNMDNKNDIRYYYVDAISKDNGYNTYTYKGVIDVYTSYTLKFIYDNFDNEFVFMRSHDYSKKALQIRDENLDNIPKIYSRYYFQKVKFNYDESENVWYGENFGISGNDLVNANKYYVFKDGVNGGYEFYPVLSKARDVTLYYKEKVKGNLKYEGHFSNGSWKRYKDYYDKVEIPDEVNANVVKAYENDEIIEYYYHQVNKRYVIPCDRAMLSDYVKIDNQPYGTMPIDIRSNCEMWNNAGEGLRAGNFATYVLGNRIYHDEYYNLTACGFGDLEYACDHFRNFMVKIYHTGYRPNKVIVKNSYAKLDELRRQDNNINKFLGVYYLPHFLNFKRFNIRDGYVYVTINPQGDEIGLFNIYEYNVSNVENKINNTSYSTPYLLRYLAIKYYGNNVNVEYRVNDMSKVFIGGKLFFTDTANIISKSDEMLSLEKSIITYPYQLPIGVDTYEQYVKANRGTTDTSFSIARQQQQLATARSITNGVISMGTAGFKAAGDFLSGDFGAAVGDIVGGITAGVNTGFDVGGQLQGMRHLEQKIRAQYEKANNTMGNEIHFSNINDASLTYYYDSNDGEQFEGVEVSELDKNIISLMNNYILLFGYLAPEKSTFKSRIENDRLFNYIQLDATLLLNQLNIRYDDAKFTNSIYGMLTDQLINGIRVWNRDDELIPEYNDSDPWPSHPNDTRPNLPPPPPPLPGVIEMNWEIEANWKFNNKYGQSWFDYNTILDISNDLAIVDGYNNINQDYVCGETNSSTWMYRKGLDKNKKYILNIDCKNLKLSDYCIYKDPMMGIGLGKAYVNQNNDKNLTINFLNVSDEITNYLNTNADGKNVIFEYNGKSTDEKSCNINIVTVNGKVVYE